MKTPALVVYSDISVGNMRGKTHIEENNYVDLQVDVYIAGRRL